MISMLMEWGKNKGYLQSKHEEKIITSSVLMGLIGGKGQVRNHPDAFGFVRVGYSVFGLIRVGG